MAEIELTPDTLIVHMQGLDKLWALRSRLEIPLAHIAGATIDPRIASARPEGLRLGGTYVPGVLAAGTFGWPGGDLVFWDVHHPDQAIVVYLHDERYAGLVIEVADPEQAVTRITRALRDRALPRG